MLDAPMTSLLISRRESLITIMPVNKGWRLLPNTNLLSRIGQEEPSLFHRNELQIDYFSDSYRRFESDFYHYSALDTPLTFLIDDILLFMFKSKKNYFKLNKENAKDHRDHYFIFSIETFDEQKSIRKFIYNKTVSSLKVLKNS